MKKSSKILLGTMLPVSMLGVVSSALFISSCSNASSSTFNPELFEKNDYKKYMDLTGTGISENADVMNTTNVANTLLATSEGYKSYISTYSDQFLVDWFSKTDDPILNTYYNDQLETLEEEYDEKLNSYKDMNLFQRDVLDPTGGTKQTYIYNGLVSKLKQQLSDSIFARDYLGIQTSNGFVKLDSQSAIAREELNSATNINGATPGTRNNFVFSAQSVNAANPFDEYYADFVSFIFEEWTKETLPIITPTVLFKQSTGTSPENSGLFSPVFFGASALEGAESTYKFQWFDPANANYSSPNATMKYKGFVSGISGFVDSSKGGAINIPKRYTDDSSTMLITNGKTCYTDFVTPFAAAAMYNFSTLVFGTTGLGSATLDSSNIMKNFLSTQASSTSGYFTLPYTPTNAFTGDYAGTQSVRETFKVNNSPFIATRDEFGVHIIGIDRYDQIQKAAALTTGTPFENAIVEIQNTVLWRTAQKIMSSGDENADNISLELKSTLKTYFDENSSKLIFKYLNDRKKQSNSNNKYLFSDATIGQDQQPLKIDLTDTTSAKNQLMSTAIKLNEIEEAISFVNTVNDKMYTLQSSFANTQQSDWKLNGLAGVLPYTRDTSGNFSWLTDISSKILNKDKNANTSIISTLYKNTKSELATKIQALNLAVASEQNYFNGDVGKPVGISQYEFVNDWNVNSILVKDSSAGDVVNLYNQLWDQKNINDSIKNFTTEINNPTTFEQNVANQIIKQIPSNYSISTAFASNNTKASTNLDFTDLEILKTSATNWINKKIQDNVVSDNYSLMIGANSDFTTFLKTLTWLLSPTSETSSDGQTKTSYSFSNLIDVLNEIVDNEYTKVGYIGWMSESNLSFNPNFGNNVSSDFSYKNPVNMTNINSYSYYNVNYQSPTAANSYYGNNQTYFNSAKMKSADSNPSNGFLGFQSSSSTLTTSSLPSDLYTGKLLTQNTSDTGYKNFTGLFYRFNETGDSKDAQQAMKDYYSETTNFYELREIAQQIQSFGLGILNNEITLPDSTTKVKINEALNMIIFQQQVVGGTITLDQASKILLEIIDQIPLDAFNQLQANSLYTADINNSSTNVFVDNTTWNTTQYVVSQFNKSDITDFKNFIESNTSADITSPIFANMDNSAFFGAIVLLAQNSEIQSRSSTHWNNVARENKVVVYNYAVAQKLGESIVKNWDDFKL